MSYYKIGSYDILDGKKVISEKSKIVKATTMLKQPKIKATQGNQNLAKVSWSKIPGANGYEICRSSSKNGKYTKIANSKKVTVSISLKEFKKKSYIKVRAYRIVNKNKVYSKYSTPILME